MISLSNLTMGAQGLPGFLENPQFRLIFFGGKGGVGKTTCAAAAALRYARRSPQGSFLLVSTDPAHSLADSIGDFHLPDNLKILEFNAQDSLATFKARHRAKFAEIAARGTFLDEADIRRILDLSLPGLDELMALLAIAGWAETRAYDLIVVDTAPTGHTLRLLTTPELIRGWLKALDALLAKHRFMQQRFRGSYQRDELDEFLLDLAASVKQMEGLLRNPRACRFVPVMLAEDLVISETLQLLGQLQRMHIPVTEVVVNRLYPENSCPLCAEARRRQRQLLNELFSRGSLGGYTWWGVPLCPEEMRGPVLETLWDGVSVVDAALPTRPQPPLEIPPRVEAAPPCPSSRNHVLDFRRQGGRGQDHPGLRHRSPPGPGVSGQTGLALLHRPGPLPGRLPGGEPWPPTGAPRPGPDGHGDRRPRGIRRFKDTIPPRAGEFPANRVREFRCPLRPPGDGTDAGPLPPRPGRDHGPGAGHGVFGTRAATIFLSWIRPPPDISFASWNCRRLVDQWLKTFFGLLLKYKLTFRFPDISQQLVRISRNLKQLRNLWRDPARAALYAVTILTEMAFQETSDLLAVCRRLGVPVPVLLLNLATPAGDCPLCAALNRREALIRDKFQQTFPGHQTVIYRQSEPRGLQRLTALGQALYRPGIMENHHGAVADMPALSG